MTKNRKNKYIFRINHNEKFYKKALDYYHKECKFTLIFLTMKRIPKSSNRIHIGNKNRD